jgi:hypothetical protein
MIILVLSLLVDIVYYAVLQILEHIVVELYIFIDNKKKLKKRQY